MKKVVTIELETNGSNEEIRNLFMDETRDPLHDFAFDAKIIQVQVMQIQEETSDV